MSTGRLTLVDQCYSDFIGKGYNYGSTNAADLAQQMVTGGVTAANSRYHKAVVAAGMNFVDLQKNLLEVSRGKPLTDGADINDVKMYATLPAEIAKLQLNL